MRGLGEKEDGRSYWKLEMELFRAVTTALWEECRSAWRRG